MPTTRSQSRAARAIAAANRVFSIPELLELSLLKAERRDLNACRRVNSAFKATIEGSKALKRKFKNERSKPIIHKTARRALACKCPPRKWIVR
ncbi:hypothetical protein PRZ48_012402 [Zasmidium cellare]|uniref:Ribosomal protein S20 n=1 Tax=Zasmidium cellare TaxID=395010 RepID=A0ABR0E4R4_ZASCE|nr:hypothetical protein PRZ48_012402 [Zasmidium cellare]